MADADNVDLARSLVELWNAGDIDAVVDLYTEDAAMIAGEDWPDQAEYHGREGVRANIERLALGLGDEPDRGRAHRGARRARGCERRLGHARARERHRG